MIAVMPNSPNATPRRSGGKVSARMAWAIGCRPPPPVPCRMRNRISSARLGASPQSSELTVNRTMHVMKNCTRPNAPAIQPLMGSTMAFETR